MSGGLVIGSCKIANCEGAVKARGLCGAHLHRLYRYGDPEAGGPTLGGDPMERFRSKVDRRDGCHIWTGGTDRAGYGRFAFGGRGKHVLAHRWIYDQRVGPIPDGLEIDHLCRVRNCVNPAHLEVVTRSENMRRARRNRCSRGHEYDRVTVRPNGHRQVHCHTCRNERHAA